MTGRIPDVFIETLLNRTDLVELVGRHVSLKKSSNHFVACCPFHQEKTPSFNVNVEKQFYKCFGCQVHGDAIQFVMEIQHLSFIEAVEMLATELGLEMPSQSPEEQAVMHRSTDLFATLNKAADFYELCLKNEPSHAEVAKKYLKSRGVSGIIAKQFKLGYAPSGWQNLHDYFLKYPKESEYLQETGLSLIGKNNKPYDRFRSRIMFPIQDRRGRIVGFGGRALDEDNPPKYLNSPETELFHKSSELYGLYNAKQHNKTINELIVVEGYMDVIALAQAGIQRAVATLGTALTPSHIDELFKNCDDLVFCFDGDAAGRSACQKAFKLCLSKMSDGRRAKFVCLPVKEDPDSLIRKEGLNKFTNRMEQAPSFSDYLFSQGPSTVDRNSIDGRAKLGTLYKSLINQLPKGFLQEMLYDKLAEFLGLDKSSVRQAPKSVKRMARPTINHNSVISPAKKAAAILITHRSLLALVNDAHELLAEEMPDNQMFIAVVDLLKKDINWSFLDIIQNIQSQFPNRFSLDEMKAILNLMPEQGREQEFKDCIDYMRKIAAEKTMKQLLAKAKLRSLSNDEIERLNQLLKKLSS